jgi:hypothetical protein
LGWGLGEAQNLLPAMTWNANGLTWTLPKLGSALEDGLSYAIEVSADALTWHPAGSSAVPNTIVADNSSQLTVRLDAGASSSFMRFTVEIPADLEATARTFLPLEVADWINSGYEPVYSSCASGSCGCRSAHP